MVNDSDKRNESEEAAVDLIRKKLTGIYADEPDAKAEIEELNASRKRLSKHQIYMDELTKSGKTLAEIQTTWHQYYVSLPDEEKRQVWSEFYEQNGPSSKYFQKVSKQIQDTRTSMGTASATKVIVADHSHSLNNHPRRGGEAIKHKIVKKVTANGKLKAKHHLQSLIFGLSLGLIVIFVLMFSFFNEVFIAPFIQPSRTSTSVPIILSSANLPASAGPEIIIPKINLEIPVDFSQTSTDENVIEGALNSGVVHYPSTVFPGQSGNAAFFGHSSNNIFNPGQYKFAFVLLHTLVPGDTFYLIYQHQVFAYQVFDKKIVPPSDVSVLGNVAGKDATATLITCDPPGTSINRLVVWGEQVSPSTTTNTSPTPATTQSSQPATLPGNGPTLWGRLTHWIFN
jgi:sortase A